MKGGQKLSIRECIEKVILSSKVRRTRKEWREILKVHDYHIGNCIKSNPKVRDKILFERKREIHKFPIDKVLKKMKKYSKKTYYEWSEILGFTHIQLIGAAKNYPEMKEFIRTHTTDYAHVLSEFKRIGGKRTIEEWEELIPEFRRRKHKLKITTDLGDVFVSRLYERVKILENSEPKTMTEWAKYFQIDLSSMCKFVDRYNVRHLLKKNRRGKSVSP